MVNFVFDRGLPGPNIEFPEGRLVLFLWRRQVRGTTNLEPFWRPRDVKFGALPASPSLVDSLKRIAAVQSPKSGEVQLEALIRRFVPECTLQELKYNIGEKTYATAILTGLSGGTALDRR